ncbi:MAG: secretin N-terminal domain-containing protein [Planctomycetota bacterium JB042]
MQAPLRAIFAALTVLASTSFAPTAHAQEVDFDENDNILIQFDEIDGTLLEDFIKLCEIQTGKQLNYSEVDTKDVRLRFIGRKVLPRDQFWPYFQAVLKAYDFVIVPYGNIGAPGRPAEGPDTGFFAIRRSNSSGGGTKPGYIKSQAPVVSPDQLEAFKYDPGIVLTTSFTLKYVNVQEATNMLQTYFTDPMLESIRAVTNSNALVATGFAQTLYGIKRLLELIDTKPDEFTPRFAKVELEHAVAEEIQPIVKELIDAERGVGGTGGAGRPANAGLPPSMQELEPQISVEPRSNTLLVVAAEETLEKILHYIRMLDVEVDPRGDTHVYRLKNSASKDLEEILNEWAQNTQQSSGGASGAQGGQAGGGSLEQPVTVVADESSNSLIITASKSRYAQVLEIVKKLDVRRRQVLIETALVEISGTLSERLGVELGYVSVDENPDSDSNRGFGVTSFGLSTLTDTDGDGIVDFRVPSGLTPDTSGTPGITAGIFSGKDFAVPVIISALKSTGDTNVLSMPSILVNDNENAVISSTDERPTFNVNQGVNSDQTSFDEFQEAGITLNISPSISAGNYLRLLVKLEVSTFTEPEGNPPPIARREIDTSVTLPDGHTMVVGGIVSDESIDSQDGVPWLSELPLFGFLFRQSFDSDNRINLYAFITPHIISDDFANLDDLSYAKKKELEALNGKIHIVDPDWDRDNADTRILDSGIAGVFDLPAYASPPAGEVGSPTSVSTPTHDGWGELPVSPPEDTQR